VAFYSGQQPLNANALQERLNASLPKYMVPTAFHWRNRLPLTDNGKIDKKALKAGRRRTRCRRAEPRAAEHGDRTPAGGRWAEVLGVPKDQIGRRDQFFDLGGTSLSALKLAVRLNRTVSLKDLTDHPVLADLAILGRRTGLCSGFERFQNGRLHLEQQH